jgi:hypothetical protein
VAFAISLMVFPLTTEWGSLLTGLRRARRFSRGSVLGPFGSGVFEKSLLLLYLSSLFDRVMIFLRRAAAEYRQ